MAQDETIAQADSQSEASTTHTPNSQEEAATSTSINEMESSTPSNVLDTPIESEQDDLIGTKDLQDGLIDYIKRAEKPFTIALQGEWGLGKTSFLNLLKSRLCNSNKSLYYSVSIDACDFTLLQSPTEAVINMLQSMVYQIGNLNPTIAADQQGKEYINKTVFFIKNIGKSIIKNVTTKGAEAATVEGLAEATFDSLLNDDKPNNSQTSTLSIVKKLRNDITNLIKYIFDPNNKANYILTDDDLHQNNTTSNITQTNLTQDNSESGTDTINNQEKQGIIFFIDNLDRIDPTLAVEILEVTKNIFNFNKCVFIIAFDNNILLRGLQSKLGDLTKDNVQVFQSYLDKFVQLSISLGLKDTAISNLLFSLLNNIGIFNDRELDIIIDGETEGSKETLRNRLVNFTLFFATCNPRSIKRFTNTLSLILSIIKAQNSDDIINDTTIKTLIFIITCIQIFKPELFNKIFAQPIYTHSTGVRVNTIFSSGIDHTLRSIKNEDSLYSSAQKLLNIIKVLKNLELKNSKTQSHADFDEKLTKAINTITFLYINPPFSN